MPVSDPARLARLVRVAIAVRWSALVLMVAPIIGIIWGRESSSTFDLAPLGIWSAWAAGGLMAVIAISLGLDAYWTSKLDEDSVR